MVRALYEAGSLYRYVTGGVDSFRGPVARAGRALVAATLSGLDRQLGRRAVAAVPESFVESHWGWEAPRVAAAQLGMSRLEDWAWERSELALDRACARLLQSSGPTAFLGVEHGALAALRAAKGAGKPGVVAFLSPHHRTRARWVDAESAAEPGLRDDASAAIDTMTARRDHRRDVEAETADWIVTNSSFTTRSLVDAGFSAGKMLTVPLGGPEPMPVVQLPQTPQPIVRFIYVGPLSVRKGAHYLLRAWRRVAGPGTELHFYGKALLPAAILREAMEAPGGESITFHGSIPAADLPAVYQAASVLVLPTLCDGFGMVVSEALANGLPAITTRNAGAADAIDDGRSGFVIPPADEDALADRLQWCVAHPAELFEMRHAALAASGRWTWTDFRHQFAKLLVGAVGARHVHQPSTHAGVRVAG
jgi:glycosyltransferase involved in cell wall biosynthesis